MEDCYFEQEKQKINALLPPDLRRILPYVETECDRLEYSGSRMFDETPDGWMMGQMCDRIYEQVQAEAPELLELDRSPSGASGEQSEEQSAYYNERLFATGKKTPPPERESDFKSLIWSLLGHEFYFRRCRDHAGRCRHR